MGNVSENNQIIDVIRTLIPVFSVLIGSALTYKLTKKDKIRDHLFNYKVKSYAEISKNIIETKLKLETIRIDYYIERRNRSFFSLYEEFNKVTAEQSLFLSSKTKEDIDHFKKSLTTISNEEILGGSFQSLIPLYTASIYECKVLIEKMQIDIGFNKI